MLGLKLKEYRSIKTNIRERIYIYASNTLTQDEGSLRCTNKLASELPLGFLIGTVEITNCTGSKRDGFTWQLKNPMRLENPIKPKNKPQPVWFKPF